MKTLPKKRGHQTKRNLSIIFASAAGAVKHQALWYAACISLYAWCMYWISRDIFFWHKPLAEISALNYAGAVTAVALIWLGSRIWRNRPNEAQKAQLKQPQPPPQQPAATGFACAHYLGYLRQLDKSAEIPAECLTCRQVIQCFSTEK